MPYLYRITPHSLSWIDPNGVERRVTTNAYSGYPPDVNDAECCSISLVGPLPANQYVIRPAVAHPMLGPIAMYLDPVKPELMFGRGGFFMHGDSIERPGYASHGCIILPHNIRQNISDGKDRALTVKAE